MSFLSRRIQNIKPSATLSVTQKANELRAAGIDVISLSAGEPDFDTPDFIKKASYEALEKGASKYTNIDGLVELKKAIQKKFSSENQINYELNEIMVNPGVKFGIYAAMIATLNEGDEVIIPTPYWPSYLGIVVVAGGTPVEVFCPIMKLTADQLEKAITPKTKWLLLNSPSNPSGVVYSREEYEQIAAVLRKHPHVHILSDEIYEHLVYEGVRFYSFAHVAPDLKDRTLTLNGVSKAYAMTGWRIGYAAGPVSLIKAMCKLQSQSTSNPTTISQHAAIEALTGPQDCLTEFRDTYAQRRKLMVDMLRQIKGFSCQVPEGAFYTFPDIHALMGLKTPQGKTLASDIDMSEYLLEEARVATVPGSAFGQPHHLRLSFATSDIIIEKALDRIKQAIEQLHN